MKKELVIIVLVRRKKGISGLNQYHTTIQNKKVIVFIWIYGECAYKKSRKKALVIVNGFDIYH